jgi:sensor histidine kinase YesM
MGVRMGARLQTQLSLPEELRAVGVPPLLLQPLVENSIKHGLEPKVAGGRIEVSAQRDGGMLVLSVLDSGVGLEATAQPGESRFGLQQVRERLQTLHGGRASLELQDAAGGGTLARIRLPLTP